MVLCENRILKRSDVISELPFLEKKKKQQSSRPVTEDAPETGKTVAGLAFLYLTFFLSSRFQVLTFFLYKFSHVFDTWSNILKHSRSERLK